MRPPDADFAAGAEPGLIGDIASARSPGAAVSNNTAAAARLRNRASPRVGSAAFMCLSLP